MKIFNTVFFGLVAATFAIAILGFASENKTSKTTDAPSVRRGISTKTITTYLDRIADANDHVVYAVDLSDGKQILCSNDSNTDQRQVIEYINRRHLCMFDVPLGVNIISVSGGTSNVNLSRFTVTHQDNMDPPTYQEIRLD